MVETVEKTDVYTEAKAIRAELVSILRRVEALPENKWFASAEVEITKAQQGIQWGILLQRQQDERGGLAEVLVR